MKTNLEDKTYKLASWEILPSLGLLGFTVDILARETKKDQSFFNKHLSKVIEIELTKAIVYGTIIYNMIY